MENCRNLFPTGLSVEEKLTWSTDSWSGIVLNSTLCLRIRSGYEEKLFKMIPFFDFFNYVLFLDGLPASISFLFAETRHYL